MGSNGTKAVAAAVLGAQCTCVDISPVNARYCGKVAAAAGVTMDFVVADVLNLPSVVEQGETVAYSVPGVDEWPQSTV
jgi:23S rRNA G2069 N7-methylase RlmK/C1962 C5-methylase RlmI